MFNTKLKNRIKQYEDFISKEKQKSDALGVKLEMERSSYRTLLSNYNRITEEAETRKSRLFEIDFIYKKEIITAINFSRGEGGYYFHGDVGVIAYFIFEGIYSIVEITKEKYEEAAK